jgi:enoyl-CoA hydratase
MIEREVHGDVAVLRLAHGKASALDLELLAALDAALQGEEDAAERALVLTGSGTIFCAGVDLKRIVEGGRNYVEAFLPALDRTFARLFFLEKPAVAAVNGHAIAGGAVLAFACERRILARGKALLGTPELRVGVPFPVLALEIVRAAAGDRLAAELALEGRNYNGEDSLRLGLVDELVSPEAVLPRALECAKELARVPRESYALTKRWLRAPALERWQKDRAANARAVYECWNAASTQSAIEAFVARTLK